ncbi:universal stress protein [Achromobacter aloeverae]
MTTRLLAITAEALTTAACLDAAYAAASVLDDAEIEALHVVVDPLQLIGTADEIALQQARIPNEGSAQERETAVWNAYDRWRSRHPDIAMPVSWKTLVGAEADGVQWEGESFDLLVIARPRNLDGKNALHAAIYHTRRPLLFVPGTWRANDAPPFGRHICIAWRNTASCERAIAGAMPWLRRAGQITLLTIGVGTHGVGGLKERLSGEGLPAQVFQVESEAAHPGEQILNEAYGLGADLLVMGAYRHNWLFELLVHSTTRQVLAKADLPLLMSH